MSHPHQRHSRQVLIAPPAPAPQPGPVAPVPEPTPSSFWAWLLSLFRRRPRR